MIRFAVSPSARLSATGELPRSTPSRRIIALSGTTLTSTWWVTPTDGAGAASTTAVDGNGGTTGTGLALVVAVGGSVFAALLAAAREHHAHDPMPVATAPITAKSGQRFFGTPAGDAGTGAGIALDRK